MNIITLPLGPLETNCYVVFENAPGACALVDPGAQAQSILDCLKERGLTPGLILLTHAHFDHAGACKELQDAGIPATRYHAGLDEEERRRNQDDFQFDRRTASRGSCRSCRRGWRVPRQNSAGCSCAGSRWSGSSWPWPAGAGYPAPAAGRRLRRPGRHSPCGPAESG